MTLLGLTLTLAIALPLLVTASSNWAEARADRQAAALGGLLHEAGAGIEAALAANVFKKANFAASSVTTLTDAQVATLFSVRDVAPYLNVTALNGINMRILVGRQGSGPVEGVVVLQSSSVRGALILRRMRNAGIFTNGQAAATDVRGREPTTQSFMSASGIVVPAGAEFVAYSTADVAGLDVSRVIRQDRRVIGAPTRAQASDLDMNSNTVIGVSEVNTIGATSKRVTPPAAGFTSQEGRAQSLSALSVNTASLMADRIVSTGSATSREGYVTGAVTSGNMSSGFHLDLKGLIVSEDLNVPFNVALRSQITSVSSNGGAGTKASLVSATIDSLNVGSARAQGFFAERIQANSITTQTKCRGC